MSKENYPLVKTQIRLLKLLYKFRFGTTVLLSEYVGIEQTTMNRNLKKLMDRELITRHLTNTDRLEGKAARYFLTTKGIKELKVRTELDDGVVRSYYKNKTVSEVFIDHNLNIFSAYLTIQKQYPGRFTALTKSEVSKYEQFPPIKPDLFLQSKNDSGDYFLYIYEDTQLFVIQKHIKQLIEHSEEEDYWGDTYPDVLIAAPNPSAERKIIRRLENSLEDFDFFITTSKALLAGNQHIWTDPTKLEEPIAL